MSAFPSGRDGDRPAILVDGRYPDLEKAFAADYRVHVASLDGVAALGEARAAIRALVTAGDRPVMRAVDELPALGLIALIGSGFEGVEHAALRARGVRISHAPGASADDVATHAVALFLAHNRRILAGDGRIRAGLWRGLEDGPAIRSASNLRAGVVGLGRIGAGIAGRLEAFGCDLAWWGPRLKPDAPWPRSATLNDLAAWSDVLFLALRAGAATDGLVDAGVIEALGPGSLIVNVSRGSVIDENALLAALGVGQVGAALDVFRGEPDIDPRWSAAPNTVLTPHCAARGDGTRATMLAMVRDNLERFFAGRPLAQPVPGGA